MVPPLQCTGELYFAASWLHPRTAIRFGRYENMTANLPQHRLVCLRRLREHARSLAPFWCDIAVRSRLYLNRFEEVTDLFGQQRGRVFFAICPDVICTCVSLVYTAECLLLSPVLHHSCAAKANIEPAISSVMGGAAARHLVCCGTSLDSIYTPRILHPIS